MKAKVKPRLYNHRTVATMLDIDTETLRAWVSQGIFPRPRAIVSQTWFYDAKAIDHFIDKGTWPEGHRPRVVEDAVEGYSASPPSPNPST